jgi:hypothetical protein
MSKLWPIALLGVVLLALLSVGCTARPMICIPVKLDGGPAFGCVDASDVKGSHIEPWDGAPSPSLPESEPETKPNRLGPYWKYEGWEKDNKETSAEGGVCCVYNGKWTCRLCSLGG